MTGLHKCSGCRNRKKARQRLRFPAVRLDCRCAIRPDYSSARIFAKIRINRAIAFLPHFESAPKTTHYCISHHIYTPMRQTKYCCKARGRFLGTGRTLKQDFDDTLLFAGFGKKKPDECALVPLVFSSLPRRFKIEQCLHMPQRCLPAMQPLFENQRISSREPRLIRGSRKMQCNN